MYKYIIVESTPCFVNSTKICVLAVILNNLSEEIHFSLTL